MKSLIILVILAAAAFAGAYAGYAIAGKMDLLSQELVAVIQDL